MNTRKPPTQPAGTTNAKIKLPTALHQLMKTLRKIRHDLEGSDVKLCRLFREAVEQYVYAEPQQKLLKEYGDGTPKTGKTGDRLAVREAARV